MTSSLENLQLITQIMNLDECKTVEKVSAALSEISISLGFDGFMYVSRFFTGGTQYVERVLSNYDPSWLEKYEKNHYTQVDPMVSHAMSSLCPLVWTDAIFETCAQREFMEEARQHGLVQGITFPVHSRNGDVALLNLMVSRAGDEARRHVREMLIWGSLLATLTHESMRRIVKDQCMAAPPKLTRRETEVLQWVAGGKSNWEISRLVGISEHGVSHHVRNVLLKFDVASRHQAVTKAVAFGLLPMANCRVAV